MKVFYHNDIDGKCAGAMVARFTGNYNKDNYIMYDYSCEYPFEIVNDGETVYIVDLSFSLNTVDKLKELIEKDCEIIWCDHHASSLEMLKEHPEFNSIKGFRKNGISGAALTYMYLFERVYEDIPKFIKHVSDFDCWHHEMEGTLEFKYGVESNDYDVLSVFWNKLIKDSYTKDNKFLNSLIESGKIISKYVESEYESYRERYAYESVLDGHKCLVVNRSCNSLIFGELIKEYPLVVIWAFNGDLYKYSIYSDKEDIDCSKIAENHLGGGHKGASGFVCKAMILPKIEQK